MDRRRFILGSLGAAAMVALPIPVEEPFPHGWVIVEETIDPGMYFPISQRYAKALARSMMQTKEIVARNVLERAFDYE